MKGSNLVMKRILITSIQRAQYIWYNLLNSENKFNLNQSSKDLNTATDEQTAQKCESW